jgi:hypothetical protein
MVKGVKSSATPKATYSHPPNPKSQARLPKKPKMSSKSLHRAREFLHVKKSYDLGRPPPTTLIEINDSGLGKTSELLLLLLGFLSDEILQQDEQQPSHGIVPAAAVPQCSTNGVKKR